MIRNILYGVCGEAVAGALNFLTFVLIARALGASDFGQFSYLLAFVGIFQLLADCGLTNILVREIARDRARVGEILGAARPLVWAFSLVVWALIALVGWPLSPTPQLYLATLLLGAAVLATVHSVTFGSVCRAFEEMGYNAVGNVAHKLVQIGLVLLALHEQTGVVGVSAAILVANVAQWMFFQTVVGRRYVTRIVWRMDRAYWRYLLTESIPIGFAMLFRRANLHVGTLTLGALSAPLSVGLFNAAYKIVQMLDMIPFTLAIPLFPRFSQLARDSRPALFDLLTRALRLFLLLAAPLAVWSCVMAPWLIDLLFGAAFSAAVPTLRVLVLVLLLLFVTALYAYLFSALGRQRFFTLSSAAALAVNLLCSAILIPQLDHLGAALAVLLSEATFCVSGIVLLYRLGYRAPVLRVAVLPVLLALVAAAPLLWSDAATPVGAVCGTLLFGLIYVGMVLVSGALTPAERGFLRGWIVRRPAQPQEAG